MATTNTGPSSTARAGVSALMAALDPQRTSAAFKLVAEERGQRGAAALVWPTGRALRRG